MSEEPTCLLCGKPLKKQTHSMDLMIGETMPKTYLDGTPIVEVISRKKSTIHPGEDQVRFWCGKWGGYGDNFFCGLNCGYAWALMRVKLTEKEDPGYVACYRKFMKDAENKRNAEKQNA